MAKYAPKVVLALYAEPTAPPEGPNLTIDAKAHTIYWRPKEGLTVLLHEIGHTQTVEPSGGPRKLNEVWREAFAWEWAERTAREEDLFFDYRKAERLFDSYARKLPVRLRWRQR